MSASALFFIILGVCVVVRHLMRLVLWLDTSRPVACRMRRSRPQRAQAPDFPVAELWLEQARHAA
jgi:hypothetical protein